jgi:flagellar basal body-associated protein FliL
MSTPNYPEGYPSYPGGQPGYGQPGYGQSGYGPPMGQMPPPTLPKKKSRRGLWIILSIIVVLLLACIAGFGILFYNAAQIALQPLQAAQNFCNDLKTQDYSSAYTMLSTNYQGQVTQTQFTQGSQLHDQIDGKVQSCAPASNNNFSFNLGNGPTTASFNATVTRNKAFTGKISMVKEGSAWRVDALDQSLQGTDIGPIVVANTFCQALVAQDYKTAYSTLSARQQGLATEAQFASQIQSGLGASVKITGCTPNYSSYAASVVPNTSATLNSSLNVSTQGTTVPVPTTLTFVYESGTWKIDNFKVNTQ